jgi:hypothetical protein
MSFVNDNMNKHKAMQITINIEHIKYIVYIFACFSRLNKKFLISIIKIAIKTLGQVYLLN